MKTSHQSTKKCKYRTLEKYSNTYYKNKQNINPVCACHIYLINSIILFYLFIFKIVYLKVVDCFLSSPSLNIYLSSLSSSVNRTHILCTGEYGK
jgi:hypothetical protein